MQSYWCVVTSSYIEIQLQIGARLCQSIAIHHDLSTDICSFFFPTAPFIEKLSESEEGVEFYKMDVDEVGDVAANCGISAMREYPLCASVFLFPSYCLIF